MQKVCKDCRQICESDTQSLIIRKTVKRNDYSLWLFLNELVCPNFRKKRFAFLSHFERIVVDLIGLSIFVFLCIT